jgi:hypothetical protein
MGENELAKQDHPAARLKRPQDRELHWRNHVAAWRTSGLTQAAYSREHGLAPADLSWWKHDLARRDLKRKAERAPASRIPRQSGPSEPLSQCEFQRRRQPRTASRLSCAEARRSAWEQASMRAAYGA